MSSAPLAGATDIHKSCGPNPVLRGVSFQVGSGELAGIVGGAGFGSTRTLRIPVRKSSGPMPTGVAEPPCCRAAEDRARPDLGEIRRMPGVDRQEPSTPCSIAPLRSVPTASSAARGRRVPHGTLRAAHRHACWPQAGACGSRPPTLRIASSHQLHRVAEGAAHGRHAMARSGAAAWE